MAGNETAARARTGDLATRVATQTESRLINQRTPVVIARWTRRAAVSPDWSGSGIVNAVAPGFRNDRRPDGRPGAVIDGGTEALERGDRHW